MPPNAPGMRLWMRRFRSFRNVLIETPLGLLGVHGDEEVASSDDLTGWIAVEAGGPEPGGDWFAKADGLLRHIHRRLALARGGRLQTPRLDRWWGGTVEHTFYAGEGFDAELPVIHRLHHGPFLRALVDRYFRAGPLPEGCSGALGWTQPGNTFRRAPVHDRDDRARGNRRVGSARAQRHDPAPRSLQGAAEGPA